MSSLPTFQMATLRNIREVVLGWKRDSPRCLHLLDELIGGVEDGAKVVTMSSEELLEQLLADRQPRARLMSRSVARPGNASFQNGAEPRRVESPDLMGVDVATTPPGKALVHVILMCAKHQVAATDEEPLPRQPAQALGLVHEEDRARFREPLPGQRGRGGEVGEVDPAGVGVTGVQCPHRGTLSSPTIADELERDAVSGVVGEQGVEMIDVWRDQEGGKILQGRFAKGVVPQAEVSM